MFIGTLNIEVEPERVTADDATNGRKLVIYGRPFGHEHHLESPEQLEALAAHLQREAAAWRTERSTKEKRR